jgi:hypothetical protein
MEFQVVFCPFSWITRWSVFLKTNLSWIEAFYDINLGVQECLFDVEMMHCFLFWRCSAINPLRPCLVFVLCPQDIILDWCPNTEISELAVNISTINSIQKENEELWELLFSPVLSCECCQPALKCSTTNYYNTRGIILPSIKTTKQRLYKILFLGNSCICRWIPWVISLW